MRWMNAPQPPDAFGGAGVRVRARGGHLERSDLADAGGLPPEGGPKAGKQSFNKAKLIPVGTAASTKKRYTHDQVMAELRGAIAKGAKRKN